MAHYLGHTPSLYPAADLGQAATVDAAPAPAPAPARLSTAHAYVQILAVYVIGFGPAVLTAVFLLTHPHAAVHLPDATLGAQLRAETSGWSMQLPAVAVAIWLARRRGWSIRGLGVRADGAATAVGRRQAVRVAAAVFTALAVSSAAFTALAPHVSFPDPAVGGWSMLGAISGSLRTAVVEELIVTAFVISTLRQARRPAVEILAVALTARVAFHLYYASWWVLAWVAAWSGAAFALYWFTRRLTPLIVGHALFDLQALTAVVAGRSAAMELRIGLVCVVVGYCFLARRHAAVHRHHTSGRRPPVLTA